MINRIDQLFREKDGEILSIYITAGYPGLHDTPRLLKALEEHNLRACECEVSNLFEILILALP